MLEIWGRIENVTWGVSKRIRGLPFVLGRQSVGKFEAGRVIRMSRNGKLFLVRRFPSGLRMYQYSTVNIEIRDAQTTWSLSISSYVCDLGRSQLLGNRDPINVLLPARVVLNNRDTSTRTRQSIPREDAADLVISQQPPRKLIGLHQMRFVHLCIYIWVKEHVKQIR